MPKLPKLFSGMQDHTNHFLFSLMPDRDKSAYLQYLYDKGYSVRDISLHVVLTESAVRSRINAHRGRGPNPNPAPGSSTG